MRLLALLLGVFIAGLTWAANAQEGAVLPLKWEVVDKPGARGEIVLVPSEINRIATSGDVVYAVDTANSRLHRSGNGGGTFKDITSALKNSQVTLPIHEIAVAPGLPQYVAVSDNVSKVYWSADSGATWSNTSFPAAITGDPTIQCIAISNGYINESQGADLFHDLAIGTAAWGDNTAGQIWTVQVGNSIPSWKNDNLTISGAPADISAIAFSPKYKDDSTILAVASTGIYVADNKTSLCIGKRDLSAQTTIWNDLAGYPVCIQPVSGDPVRGDAPGEHITSSIALPSDYLATDIKSRMVFVSCNATQNAGANNDVYRIYDNIGSQVIRLNVKGGSGVNISRIAYYGTVKAGKLLAGGVDKVPPLPSFSVNLWRTAINENGDVSWKIATQPPTGPGNAQVAWRSSGTAFCGTGSLITRYRHDESAFSRSSDDGDTWEQTSLINTLVRMCDIAPAPDSRSLFLATFNAATFNAFGPEGVWRSAGEPMGTYWTRVLTMSTSSDMVLLRLSPDYSNDDTIYAVEARSDNKTLEAAAANRSLMAVSANRGNTWIKRYVPGRVVDMIAAGKDTLYLALPGGYVRKSTDGGLRWGDAVMTGLDNINMLALAANGDLFAGSMDSQVAYSTDNGASFIEIEDPIGLGTGYVQVVADADYSRNNIIYAADNITDDGVWRRTIGLSTEWEQIDEAITGLPPGQRISGLMTGREGTLYALRAERPKPDRASIADNNTGGMNRTLNPTAAPPINIEWDIVNRTLTDNRTAFDPGPLKFTNNPPWLKLSGNSNENVLWAIDTAKLAIADDTALIYRFRDNLCKIGPWVDGPAEVGCDPVSGRNQQVDLAWEQLSLSDRYDLQIAKDPAFALRVDPAISNSDNISSVTGSIRIRTDPVNVTSPALWLSPGSLPEAGSDYYWRVRTYHAATWEFIRSPWSDTAHFIVKPGYVVNTPYPEQQLLSPEDGALSGAQSAQQPAQAPAQRSGVAPLWAWIVMAIGIITTFVLSIMLIRRSEIL